MVNWNTPALLLARLHGLDGRVPGVSGEQGLVARTEDRGHERKAYNDDDFRPTARRTSEGSPPTPEAAYRKWIVSGRLLNLRPPKFVVARKVLKDVIYMAPNVRMGVATFGDDHGWFDPPNLLEGLRPSCDLSYPTINEAALDRPRLMRAVNQDALPQQRALHRRGALRARRLLLLAAGATTSGRTGSSSPSTRATSAGRGAAPAVPSTTRTRVSRARPTPRPRTSGSRRGFVDSSHGRVAAGPALGGLRLQQPLGVLRLSGQLGHRPHGRRAALRQLGAHHEDDGPAGGPGRPAIRMARSSSWNPVDPATNPDVGGINYCDKFERTPVASKYTKADCDYVSYNWPHGPGRGQQELHG